jgi:hypothetical protein
VRTLRGSLHHRQPFRRGQLIRPDRTQATHSLSLNLGLTVRQDSLICGTKPPKAPRKKKNAIDMSRALGRVSIRPREKPRTRLREFRPKRKARKRTVPGLRCCPPSLVALCMSLYGLWHDAGRSAAGPVHWPLCPAPLPPLVGGLGEPNAGPVVVSMPAVTSAIAAVRNRRFLI